MLVQLGPEHEINLHGAPYELVPGYYVNSLLVLMTDVISEGSGEHVRLRNLARVHKVKSGPNKILDIYLRYVLNT